MIKFPTLHEALAIHERLIEKFGGQNGLRDPGLLESALYRPQTGYYETLTEMASALFESLLLNHPFIDGNKRAAFFLMDVFLRMNGFKIRIHANDAEAFILSYVKSGNRDLKQVDSWIQKHLIAL